MESLKRSSCDQVLLCFTSCSPATESAFRIRDESGSTVVPASAAAELVKLTTVDGVWHWMVVALSDQLSQPNTVRLVLSERLETV